VILAYVAWSHLPTLDHSYLPGWDEAVHAAVAGNLVKHPMTPTLFDEPFIHYNKHNWQANHIWLHMPPMPFWQAALSLGIGGRSFFALRFPSLLLFMLTIGLVYAMGIRLYNEASGLIGATMLSASPFAWLQVQGYHFGDMTDISLAFWMIACVLALERALVTGRVRWALVSGVLQGLALLTKSALALAPAGAVVVIWLLNRSGFKLDFRIRWFVPALHVGLALLLSTAWRLYCQSNWPVEFEHEQAALWAHVTTSYEGHGRPWDAVFNDLIANLFSSALVFVALAGTVWVFLQAWARRKAAVLLHALWILGTLLPLMFVATKVPALLFGLVPALALAIGGLFVRAVQNGKGVWLAAAVVTPAIFIGIIDHLPADIWRFAEDITPDMATWPHLPIQAGIFVIAGLLFFAVRMAAKRVLKSTRLLGLGWAMLVRLAVLVPFVWMLSAGSKTRQGFRIIQDYNPAARTAALLKEKLPERAAVIIEGVTNGRQRLDLTFSFLTGRPTHVVASYALDRALKSARKLGTPILLTRTQRQGEAMLSPQPGSGFWAYRIDSTIPAAVVQEEGEVLASYADGPDLIAFEPAAGSLSAGSRLHLLATWRARGAAHIRSTRIQLEPEAGGSPDPTFPEEGDFPTGREAVTLHTLAPPGLLWGSRPLGTTLAELHRLRAGEIFADSFMIWVPAHLEPGFYRIRLELLRHGRKESPQGQVEWPRIEVKPP
jgi:hypothetical protein